MHSQYVSCYILIYFNYVSIYFVYLRSSDDRVYVMSSFLGASSVVCEATLEELLPVDETAESYKGLGSPDDAFQFSDGAAALLLPKMLRCSPRRRFHVKSER